jgi:hypothetical protein
MTEVVFFELRPRKLRPRIDLRPLRSFSSFLSFSFSSRVPLPSGGEVGILPVDTLRVKKGIPDGVRLGLSRLERERFRLASGIVGVAVIEIVPTPELELVVRERGLIVEFRLLDGGIEGRELA